MTNIPENLKYTSRHEWVETRSRGAFRVGLTDFATKQLDGIVFVVLPAVGGRFKAGDQFGSVELVNDQSDIYAPVAGQVTAHNDGLNDMPEVLNHDPYGEGWLAEITPTGPNPGPDGLLSAKEYAALIASLE